MAPVESPLMPPQKRITSRTVTGSPALANHRRSARIIRLFVQFSLAGLARIKVRLLWSAPPDTNRRAKAG
jgi:hypothetical protein